jgi:hypothetical protein
MMNEEKKRSAAAAAIDVDGEPRKKAKRLSAWQKVELQLWVHLNPDQVQGKRLSEALQAAKSSLDFGDHFQHIAFTSACNEEGYVVERGRIQKAPQPLPLPSPPPPQKQPLSPPPPPEQQPLPPPSSSEERIKASEAAMEHAAKSCGIVAMHFSRYRLFAKISTVSERYVFC